MLEASYTGYMDNSQKMQLIKDGFAKVNVPETYKQSALIHIEHWLTHPDFLDYLPQIDYLIEQEKWDLLLDCFYQIIPFGTAGRRGEVGIGPNRINTWTLQNSAQGHSQYLLQKFGEQARQRGIIVAYDVRAYLKTTDYDVNRPNPVAGLDCKTLAERLAEVYAGNGLKVMMFAHIAPTPELSFMIRYKKAVAGDMVSASHNPPEFNGQKVLDQYGGQLIPPYDEELVQEVVNNIKSLKKLKLAEAREQGLLFNITPEDHQAYLDAAKAISLNANYRKLKILYSPYHGTTVYSTLPVLQQLGFDVSLDENSGKADPDFSSIMFHIPNPEVVQSFENLVSKAEEINANLIMTADPDGDRFGLMSKEESGWRFLSGNEFFILCLAYMIEELQHQGKLRPGMVVIKTVVTTGMLEAISKQYNLRTIPDLLVGYRNIAEEMNKLDAAGKIEDFLLAGEESHGMNAGNYIREKDSCVPAILIGELAAKLQKEGKTLGVYLDELYKKFGYYRNYLTEIRLPGAEGMNKMTIIMEKLRTQTPKQIGQFAVVDMIDRQTGEPFVSESDKIARNLLIFNLQPDAHTSHIKLVVRPSGTEPKTKFYIEVGRKPLDGVTLEQEKQTTEEIVREVEKGIIKLAYKEIGIDFPDRGFLLFWMLPGEVKMKYFEIEPQILQLQEVTDAQERRQKLFKLLEFLGVDPIQKVDKAFKAEYQRGILEYLNL